MDDAPIALIVTPDPALAVQLRSALEPRGFVVVTAPSADAALMRARHRPPDVLFAQFELPGTSGVELIGQVAASASSIHSVLVCHEQSVARVPMSFAGYILCRPFSSNDLQALLSRFSGERTGQSAGGGAFSIVDPATGLFQNAGASDVVVAVEDFDGSLASGAVQALGAEDLGMLPPTSTQELPALAVEVFDEQRPVAIPVDARTSAHGIRAVRNGAAEIHDPAERSTHPHPAARTAGPAPTAIGPRTGEGPVVPSAPAQGLDQAINEGIERALRDGGSIRRTMESVVQDAITRALADAMPAIAQETARQIARNLKI